GFGCGAALWQLHIEHYDESGARVFDQCVDIAVDECLLREGGTAKVENTLNAVAIVLEQLGDKLSKQQVLGEWPGSNFNRRLVVLRECGRVSCHSRSCDTGCGGSDEFSP